MAYAFEQLDNLVNLRGKLPHDGWYEVLDVGEKTDIAIHHSLTEEGDSESFADYHVNVNGWPEVAYHFVILKDGTIEWNHQPGVLSYHVGNSNEFSLGIALVGDFRTEDPTPEQKQALFDLHPLVVEELPNYQRTRGHDEFPDYAYKACPEFDYSSVIAGDFNPSERGYLAKGDDGKIVAKLQRALLELGYELGGYGADGQYGPVTEKAVEKFQTDHDLKVDGYYGPNTKKVMRKALAESKQKLQEAENMSNNGFKDVPKDARYAEAIKWARKEGITEGKGDGTFGVGENLTREDAIVFLYRALVDK